MRIYLLFLSFSIFSIQSQTIPNRFEIFNFDVGDEFHEYYTRTDHSSGEKTRETWKKTIISKTYNQDSSEVEYGFQSVKRSKRIGYMIYDDTLYTKQDTLRYLNLKDTLVLNDTSLCSHYMGDSLYEDINKFQRVTQEFFCLGFEYAYDRYYHVGLGGWYGRQALGYPIEETNDLVYYKKGNEEWGQPTFVGIGKQTTSEFNIYPNPCDGVFKVLINNNSAGRLEIRNLNGLLVRKFEFTNQKYLTITVQDQLDSGVYLVLILTGNDIFRKKIIVQK